MELKLIRIALRDTYTIGHLYADGHLLCDTLEPAVRSPLRRKVKGLTAIPTGRYPVVVTRSPKFGRWLPLLVGVPDFSGIRIHAGNTARDTAGCILVGQNRRVGMLLDSTSTLQKVIQTLTEGIGRDGAAWITIT